jgi:C1A family cysteine protease
MRINYGWIPDLPDKRDLLFKFRQVGTLPRKVDLRSICPPIESQGSLGSCTANALTGAIEILKIKDGLPIVHMSRLFVYYNERKIEGTIDFDSGAAIRDGIKTLARNGVCTEEKWPYDIKKFQIRPSISCYLQAKKNQIQEYYRIENLKDMKICLADGFPFVFGFSVYESFETSEVSKTGNAPMPLKNEKLRGGHAVVAVGYDEDKKVFIIRNSWGEGWGDKGYFTLPMAYLEDNNLSADFWQIKRGELM